MYIGSDWIELPLCAHCQLIASASASINADVAGIIRRNQHHAKSVAPIVHSTETPRALTTEIPVTRQVAASSAG